LEPDEGQAIFKTSSASFKYGLTINRAKISSVIHPLFLFLARLMVRPYLKLALLVLNMVWHSSDI
jgi:hypothetical protein